MYILVLRYWIEFAIRSQKEFFFKLYLKLFFKFFFFGVFYCIPVNYKLRNAANSFFQPSSLIQKKQSLFSNE